jgi:sporulation protein YlmC with PRC-barrel domain
MKRKIALTALAVAGAVGFIPACASRYDQQAQTSETVNQPWFVETQPTDQQSRTQAIQQRQQLNEQQLASAEDLKDMKIQNAQGEDIGAVDKVIVDTQQDKIAYLVVSTGGFWGMGGQKAVVPWNAFQIQQGARNEPVLVLNVPQERLRDAPRGDIDALDREQAQEIHQFYGVSPYWTER